MTPFPLPTEPARPTEVEPATLAGRERDPSHTPEPAGKKQPVAFVVFQSGRRANGGVESVTQIIERLQRVRPIVITQLETPVNERWRRAGADVHVWPLPYSLNSAFFDGGWHAQQRKLRTLAWTNLRLFRLIRWAGCHVVHCNDTDALWHTVVGAKAAGAKVVFNIRGNRAPDEQQRWWKWRLAFRLSDQQVVLSEEMKRFWNKNIFSEGSASASLQVIRSIVDRTKMRPPEQGERERLRKRLGVPLDQPAFGYVATFNEIKAQLSFIENAGPELQRRLPDAHVYFLGDFDPKQNPYAWQCQAAVEQLGLGENTTFVGFTLDTAVWYRSLDGVVLASQKEGLARCMIESLACVTPVASFDVCSAREVLERHAVGRVVPAGDYAALVEAMADLLHRTDDRMEMGQRGAQLARDLFDPEAIVRDYERLYLRLGAHRSRNAPSP